MTLFKKLRSDERGVTIIEFALISIPMLTLVLGSIEFGLSMFVKASMDGALKQAARMATTGDVAITGVNGIKIDAMVRRQVSIVNGSNIVINKMSYDKASQIRKPERKTSGGATPPYCFDDENQNRTWDADPGTAGLGGADDIINYRVSVTYNTLFPFITKFVTKSRTVSLSSEVTLQNEPFAAGSDKAIKNCCVDAAAGNPVTCS